MASILGCSIFWIIYGILGLFGIQNIPEECKNKSWTKQYKRSRGIGWLILGISWIVVYFILSAYEPGGLIIVAIIILVSIPSIVYSSYKEKKYKAELESSM
jgi:hypothetical protein